MRTVVLSEFRKHGRRVFAAGLAAVLGVSFLVLMISATATMRAALSDAVAGQVNRADVVVTGPEQGDQELPADLRERVGALPGVDHAEYTRSTYLQVKTPTGGDAAALLSYPADQRLVWTKLVSGHAPEGTGQVVVDTSTATAWKVAAGQTVTVTDPDGKAVTTSVVGVVDLGSSLLTAGQPSLFAADAELARLGGEPQALIVLARDGTGAEALRQAVAGALGGDLTVRTGEQEADARAADFTAGIDVIGLLLDAFAAIALVVAAIVVANTFAILTAQRTRQYALLRCLGATRRQVFRAALLEAAGVGALASVLGAALGAALTVAGTAIANALVSNLNLSPVVPGSALGIGVAVGLVVTLVAALVPARAATRVPALAAMRPETAARRRRVSLFRVAGGLLLLVAGIGGLALAVSDRNLVPALGGGTLVMLGVLLAGPVIVPLAARLFGLPLRALGPTGRLAVGNAVRNPGRAAATSTALLVGVCLVTTMSVGAAIANTTTARAASQEYPLDLAVTAPAGERLAVGLPAQLEELSGTTKVAALHAARGTVGGKATDLLVADPAEVAGVLRRDDYARPGSLLMSKPDAMNLGLFTGEGPVPPAEVVVGGVRQRVPVVLGETGVDYNSDSGQTVVWVPAAGTAPHLDAAISQVWVRAGDDVDASAFRADVRGLVEGGNARVGGSLQQRADIEQVLDVMLWVVTGLLAVALVIAVVGIANTLGLSVLERTRESGVQRALGMTRRQLRLMLAAEALLLAVVGAAIGVGMGIAFGWVGAQTILGEITGDVPLVVPVPRLGLVVLGSMLAGVLASVLPARRAANVPPTVALAAQ
jgi:putative ABC transport system permease protein